MEYAFVYDSRTSALTPENRNKITWFNLKSLRQSLRNKGVAICYIAEGEANYRLNGYRYSVGSGEFLLINHDQDLEWSIESNSPVRGLLAFINTDFLERVCRDLQSKSHKLDGEEFRGNCGNIEVYEHVYQATGALGVYLEELASGVKPGEEYSIEDNSGLSFELAERLLISQQSVYRQLNRLTSAKLSTKKELYRRLSIAKTYIHGHLESSLDLDTLSEVACLSKFHFIRLFKEVYDQTPRQYLISLRLRKASQMLRDSQKSFHQICQEVGLKDSSSFGRLFKKTFGATPQVYRQMFSMN